MLVPLAAVVLLQKPGLRALAERNATAFLAALRRRDGGYFERTFAPGFFQTIDGRRLERKAALDQVQGGLRRIKEQRLSCRVLSAKKEGRGYVAVVAWKGNEPARLMDRPATLTATWQDEQHWTPKDGRWTLRSLATSKFDRLIE